MITATLRSGSSRRLILSCIVALAGTSAHSHMSAAGPRLLFTDIESGPGTGGQGDLGAFISIYGEGFGATQGSSSVTIGGQPVASVISWGQDNAPTRSLDRIVVQPGPGAVSGSIVVTVAGQASNGLPFTVRSGSIYFIDPATGLDGNPGTFAEPWATLWRPRQTMAAGDIVYVRGGTFTTLDPAVPGWDTLLFFDTSMAASGTAALPVAYLGYPGNPPLLQNAATRRGIYLNQDSGPLSYYVIGNFRFTHVNGPIIVNGIGHRFVGNDLFDGDEGAFEIFGDTSAIRVFGNRMYSNGLVTNKFYTIYIQGFGTNSDIDIGWNELRDQDGGRLIQIFGHLPGDWVNDVRIHDNVMVGCELNNMVIGGSDGGTEIIGTVSVIGNIIAGARMEGLRFNDPLGTLVIENNTIYGNAMAQVYLEEAAAGRVTLRDNILVAQAGQQYYKFDAGQADTSSFVPASNLVYGAGSCEVWDTGCINQDPLFASASDYHLQASSPAIDAGVATPAVRDHDGVSRPQGSAFDIGAYEWSGAAPSAALLFHTLAPCRVIDTRSTTALTPGEIRTVTTDGPCGIPSSAKSLSANMTVTGQTAPGYLTLFPADASSVPVTTNIDFVPARTRANNALLLLAADGTGVKVLNGSAGTVHLILDANGWFE